MQKKEDRASREAECIQSKAFSEAAIQSKGTGTQSQKEKQQVDEKVEKTIEQEQQSRMNSVDSRITPAPKPPSVARESDTVFSRSEKASRRDRERDRKG
jgi:hypothetical protein